MSPQRILPFHAQILSDLSVNDGLVVLARGLGLPQLINQFVAKYARTSHLVFLLNVSEDMQREINERLSIEEQGITSQSSNQSNNQSINQPVRLGRLRSINTTIGAAERQRMYLTGGVIAVTCRILIVDLLNRLIDSALIHGLMINQAHQVTEDSIETFIVRVYRQSNQAGFLKAFTDYPQSVISSGYSPLEKIMRNLQLRSLYLYPRFQLQVADSLNPHQTLPMMQKVKDRAASRSPSPSSDRSPNPTNIPEGPQSPDIHEMIISLTPAMISIQRALVECMDLCISSLKVDNRLGAAVNIKNAPLGSNPVNQSISSISLTTSLTKAVDLIIQRELDGQWHSVTAKSKQLLHDLQLLRRCLDYLISHDSLTFYRFLLTVKAQCQQQRDASVWLMTEPADRLFRMAKARVYRFKSASVPVSQALVSAVGISSARKTESNILARARAPLSNKGKKGKSPSRTEPSIDVVDDIDVSQPGSTNSTSAPSDAATPIPDSIELVLEENPKWQLLRQILDEIAVEIAAKADDRAADPSLPPSAGGPIIVCCHDQRTCSMLTRYLELGGQRLMKRTWNRFVLSYRPRRHTMQPQSETTQPALPQQQYSIFAQMTAETAALRAEAVRTIEARRQVAMKKFERERRRRMEREAKEKRAEKIGSDQVTLTQQFQAAAHRAQQKKYVAKVAQRAALSRKRKAEQKSLREKDRRILASKELAEDGSGLHEGARKRQKRSTEADLFESEAEDDEEQVEKNSVKSEWPQVLSVCDISLNLSQAPSRFTHSQSQSSHSSQLYDIDERSHESTSSAQPLTGVEALAHDFDERSLHALPDFSVIFCVASSVDVLLYRAQPSFIIMYDVELKLMREIEVFAATERDLAVRVYYCMYRDSVEQQRYIQSINAEKDAFDKLIFQKSHLIVPSNIEGRSVGLTDSQGSHDAVVVTNPLMRAPRGDLGDIGMRANAAESYQNTISRQQGSTRRGGDLGVTVGGTIIVDVREVRSSLPSLLHARGFTVVPVTLEVSDFVLAPHIAVERKSLPDLFGSFNSGRLVRQMEIACRHYKSPILLIEFDRKRSFHLVSKSELGNEISSKHIMSRLALLICAFPQIRLLWSRDAHATVALFQALKQNQPQPEVESVASNESIGMVGASDITSRANRVNQEVQRMQRDLDSSHGAAGGDDDEDDERQSAMTSFDLLRKLPGVNQSNVRALIDKVHSLKELCAAPLKSIMEWIGEINGRKLYQFLHSDASNLFV